MSERTTRKDGTLTWMSTGPSAGQTPGGSLKKRLDGERQRVGEIAYAAVPKHTTAALDHARLVVAANALDADDARELLDALGLDPRQPDAMLPSDGCA